jgi:hypothetical protein
MERKKEKVSERMKVYGKKYKETHKVERQIYRKTKKELDENYKIEQKLRSNLHTFFRGKKNKYSDLIGCTTIFFKEWLEYNFNSKMNWENYGSYWNMDHVIPISVFDLISMDEQSYCFNWKNTRPLRSITNFSRKYSVYDILLHELKLYFFINMKNSLDNKFNNICYGVSYLPKQTRNSLLDLVNS